MIESVRGSVSRKTPTYCVINIHGIGLGIFISLNTFRHIGEERQEVELLTHLHVREDALQLYGFFTESERETFRRLISVSGIGPRLAMTILSGLSVEELHQAIASDNADLLTKIPGVGKKTAQRVLLELKEKITLPAGAAFGASSALSVPEQNRFNEAMRALITLGYKQNEAKIRIEKVIKKHGKSITIEDLIKFALQEV
jgi:Holliday junction DNA helicase RuvA